MLEEPVKNSFMLPVYRRPRYPWEHMMKPALVFYFFVVPEVPSEKFYIMDRRGAGRRRKGDSK